MNDHRQFIMCVEAARLKNTIWVNSVFAVLSVFNLVSTDWVDHKILLYLRFSDCRWSRCWKLLVDLLNTFVFLQELLQSIDLKVTDLDLYLINSYAFKNVSCLWRWVLCFHSPVSLFGWPTRSTSQSPCVTSLTSQWLGSITLFSI